MNRTLWWNPTGPRIVWTGDLLLIDDLNPETHLTWKVSRWELAKLGFAALWAALRSK